MTALEPTDTVRAICTQVALSSQPRVVDYGKAKQSRYVIVTNLCHSPRQKTAQRAETDTF